MLRIIGDRLKRLGVRELRLDINAYVRTGGLALLRLDRFSLVHLTAAKERSGLRRV